MGFLDEILGTKNENKIKNFQPVKTGGMKENQDKINVEEEFTVTDRDKAEEAIQVTVQKVVRNSVGRERQSSAFGLFDSTALMRIKNNGLEFTDRKKGTTKLFLNFKNMTGIRTDRGLLLMKQIFIETNNAVYAVKPNKGGWARFGIPDITKVNVEKLSSVINQQLIAYENNDNSNNVVHVSGMDEIKKAHELLEAGIINQEEFDSIKSKCLNE